MPVAVKKKQSTNSIKNGKTILTKINIRKQQLGARSWPIARWHKDKIYTSIENGKTEGKGIPLGFEIVGNFRVHIDVRYHEHVHVWVRG